MNDVRKYVFAFEDGDGKNKILLDLAGVSTIDSSGIGEMVACYTTVAKNDGQLRLLNLSPKINDILQVTQLITVFDVFDDNSMGQREVQINLKPGAASLGFTVSDVANQVRGALFGIDAHVFSDQQEDIDVRVRLDEDTRVTSLGHVQRGLRAAAHDEVTYGLYQETKIRHFHTLLERWISR